jgi:hypothetical protein
MQPKTIVSIEGKKFVNNGVPTYSSRSWNGHLIEGLLLNTRMVQAAFDDLNPKTRHHWAYPDTGKWDADRNTHEFIEQMPIYCEHGVLAFTVNLQGGSPFGYSRIDEQVWHNSGITPEGNLRPEYLERMALVIEQADALGMVVIFGIYYFGQERHLHGEDGIRRGVINTVDWVLNQGYTNVLIEINNECNVIYQQPLLQPGRVHELIELAKSRSNNGKRLLVSTSYGGGTIPQANVVSSSDFILLHGNGVDDPNQIRAMVQKVRQVAGCRPMPVMFNEDDHFQFDQPLNNFTAALSEYASWGYFDYRMEGEGFHEGYQSVPVDWGITSERKLGFFRLAKEITRY